MRSALTASFIALTIATASADDGRGTMTAGADASVAEARRTEALWDRAARLIECAVRSRAYYGDRSPVGRFLRAARADLEAAVEAVSVDRDERVIAFNAQASAWRNANALLRLHEARETSLGMGDETPRAPAMYLLGQLHIGAINARYDTMAPPPEEVVNDERGDHGALREYVDSYDRSRFKVLSCETALERAERGEVPTGDGVSDGAAGREADGAKAK